MLTSTFPAAKAAFVNASGSQGLCSTAAGQVTCSIGSVASGDSVTYTLTYQAKGSGSIANAVTVTGTETDTAAANNSVTTSVAVNNRTPIATDDVATTNEDTPTTIAVLANDTDPDGDTLTISAITQPAGGTVLVNGNNTVTFSPSANFNGPASFTYTANDGHGGTATATVSVNVIAVNDAPSFVKGSNVTVARSAGPQAINGWAAAISRGPADESSQQLNFIVGNDNHALFSVQPNVTAAGALTFTPLATATPGTATVTVWLQDDGGTANGGVDTSAAQTFTITTIANCGAGRHRRLGEHESEHGGDASRSSTTTPTPTTMPCRSSASCRRSTAARSRTAPRRRSRIRPPTTSLASTASSIR